MPDAFAVQPAHRGFPRVSHFAHWTDEQFFVVQYIGQVFQLGIMGYTILFFSHHNFPRFVFQTKDAPT